MNIHERPSAEGLFGISWMLVLVGWSIAALSMIGALYLSEYLRIEPCVICWYLRLFMFPLTPVLMVGLFLFDRHVVLYALPLASAGWLVSVVHLLRTSVTTPVEVASCSPITPCSETQIMWMGFVAIPLLWTTVFSVINVLLIVARFSRTTSREYVA
ncbi:disulfide bond formation protein B [Azospira restricta]|uniref:Disulfide bond formation protein B n=1 Tax=Azospira restricta TaxID=404405 RepID=A0A974SQL7_9RHOO|nr:disulfide bond formation protein B [Azospira restricta]QRJ64652.1 disulfide bond formation protein B [Azospira restricta]